jgi:sortase A
VAEYPTTITSTAPASAAAREPVPGAPRSRSSIAARLIAVLLIAVGGLALLDGAITLLWQEPISALIAKIHQGELSGALTREEQVAPPAAERHALAGLATERRRISFLAGAMERQAGNGSAVGRIVIPHIGASFVVVKGTDTGDLESGPGVYSDTHFPGGTGTTAIAGHRTTYLAPFRHIDALVPGNRILLNMPYAHFTYTVVAQRTVSPSDVQAAVAGVGHPRLVLSACTPLFTAEKRLLVYARLTRTVPVGAARLLAGGVIAHPIESPLHPPRRKALPAVLESLDPHRVAPLSQ